MNSFDRKMIAAATEVISKGHAGPDNLRKILIYDTSQITISLVEAYFAQHFEDQDLLQSLVAIALEGDDSGDAPWVAANMIAKFPGALLIKHQAALEELAQHPWSYLNAPAQRALDKINDAT